MPPSTGGAWYGRNACSQEPSPVPTSGWSRTTPTPATATARRLARLASTPSTAWTCSSSACIHAITGPVLASASTAASASAVGRRRAPRRYAASPPVVTARPTRSAALPAREPLATCAAAMTASAASVTSGAQSRR
jgi:hypothetical protein